MGLEFWERFSFYGMLGILPLFLTAPTEHGGFGWSDADALTLVGVYTGLMYGLPALGGAAADRVWGHRRAVAMGAVALVFGHFLMTGPGLLPLAVARAGGGAALAEQLRHLSFYAALAALVAGNALFKSSLAVLLGGQFASSDPARERAFAAYYLAISVGGFLAGLIVGWVGERVGWHFGFAIAGLGMAAALAAFLRWRGSVRGACDDSAVDEVVASNTRARFALLAPFALALFVFEIGWFQLYGSWSLFIEARVDRTIAGFIVPVPWFEALNSLVVIAATPAIAAAWDRRVRTGRARDVPVKYVVALGLVTAAHAVLALAAATGARSPLWPALAVILLSLGEAVAWISTYGIVYRAAPPRLVAATMGLWYALTLGIGGWVAGAGAAMWAGRPAEDGFAAVAALCALAGVTLALATPALRRRAAAIGVAL